MSSSIDMSGPLLSTMNRGGWTSSGTARSLFVESLGDESLKDQIGTPNLTESLESLKKQFAAIGWIPNSTLGGSHTCGQHDILGSGIHFQ